MRARRIAVEITRCWRALAPLIPAPARASSV